MEIANNESSMVQLWLLLERTEDLLKGNYKRFCPRNIIKKWYADGILKAFLTEGGLEGALFEVCRLAELEGYEELPAVCLFPRKHRELLRAIIAVALGIGVRGVNTRALDRAFSEAFPHAARLNVSKRKATASLPGARGRR